MTGQPPRELATVTRLPVHADAVDAEIVTPEEWARVQQEKAARARLAGYRGDVVTVARVTRTAVTHPVTKSTARHIVYVGVGVVVTARRLWESRTDARPQRMMRAAETSGQFERVDWWYEKSEQAKDRRHKRRMDWLQMPFRLGKAVAMGVVGWFAALLVLGIVIALASKDASYAFAPVLAFVKVVAWLWWLFTVAWLALIALAVVVTVAGLWVAGRNAGVTPGWLQTSDDRDVDVTIDETTIARALAALRIPQITSYLKEGSPLQFLTPCRVDGRGTHCVVRLPAGVTADKVARRRADLATGLHRLAKETWPTTGTEAGILDLWIADKGALSEGAGPYPLLDDGLVDVFRGVPFGKNLRGTPVVAPLLERNTLCGGIPGQGKSTAARVMMTGAALDPTSELRIWVPDANFDFEAFRPRCSRYVMGAENERIEEILLDLRELNAEVQARGALLVRHEAAAVTRELANRNVGLHPLFCLLEEAHVAIGHPDYGQEIAKLLVDIVRLGRKRAIHLIVSTQAPTKDSIPRDVTRNCSNGIAFAVGDHVANDALLGQGAYSAGHRATELIPGADRGTAVAKGLTGERSEIVQVYFISVDREGPGGDQITPIIARSLDAIERRNRGVPGAGRRPGVSDVERDLLDDVADVLGTQDVTRARDVVARLRQLAPECHAYNALSGAKLVQELRAAGVRVTLKDGYEVVHRDRVYSVLNAREDGSAAPGH